MKIQVNTQSNVTLYEQIANQIRTLIINGTLQEGDLLPSVRNLAQQLGVSMITTRRAYTDLEQEGYVFTAPAKGTFVSHQYIERLNELSWIKLNEIIDDAVFLAKELKVSQEQLQNLIAQQYNNATSNNNHRTKFEKLSRYDTRPYRNR